ncbi:MAG TPA: hypothetical protein VFF30_15990 [Nitrososphaerales archaeon]|nr:hypothetical protein [Nitrososphaerales archaeon]
MTMSALPSKSNDDRDEDRGEATEMGNMSLADGDREYDAGSMDDAYRHYVSAAEAFKESGNDLLQGVALLRLSYVHEQRLQLREARNSALRAEEIFEKKQDQALLNDAQQRVASLDAKILKIG